MERVPSHRFVPAIEEALRITARWRPYLGRVQFLCGTDPIFAGLHSFAVTTDGRSYRDTAHCVYPSHQLGLPKTQRRTTIVLPTPQAPWSIVHELGHVLDEFLGFAVSVPEVSDYARTNRREAFAEAWTSYLFYNYASDAGDKFRSLLKSLAIR